MAWQLKIPTQFYSLSAADTKWPVLLKCLGKFVNSTHYTTEYIECQMSWDDKNCLVALHPALCA